MSVGRVIKIVSDVLFVAGLAVAGVFVYFQVTGRRPLSVFIVSSGSMAPGLPTGSLVVTSPQSTYKFGDIVTFYNSPAKKATTTHRVVGVADGQIRTAGDANDSIDPGLVPSDLIVGRVRFYLPYVGYLAAWAKTPQGFILLVIVPATIIIYEELRSLINGLKKVTRDFLNKRRAHDGTSDRRAQPDAGNDQAVTPVQLVAAAHVADEVQNAHSLAGRPAILVPVFFAALITLSISISFFVDRETSSGNVFGASAPTPTPSLPPTPTPTPNPGEPFADAVPAVSGTFGHCCDAGNLSSDPSVAASLITGAPDSPPDTDFIQISDNAVVTAQFVDNKAVDGPGADVRIHIYDTEFPGSALIEISPDCSAYTSAGTFPDTADIDIDLSTSSLSQAVCIRFTDQVAGGDPFPSLGFDLDAIEALNSVAVP